VALVADTAPVAFGAIPITTLAQVTGLPKTEVSQMVGRQCPELTLLVPFILIGMVDGRRGLREAWPAALTAGRRPAIAGAAHPDVTLERHVAVLAMAVLVSPAWPAHQGAAAG